MKFNDYDVNEMINYTFYCVFIVGFSVVVARQKDRLMSFICSFLEFELQKGYNLYFRKQKNYVNFMSFDTH